MSQQFTPVLVKSASINSSHAFLTALFSSYSKRSARNITWQSSPCYHIPLLPLLPAWLRPLLTCWSFNQPLPTLQLCRLCLLDSLLSLSVWFLSLFVESGFHTAKNLFLPVGPGATCIWTLKSCPMLTQEQSCGDKKKEVIIMLKWWVPKGAVPGVSTCGYPYKWVKIHRESAFLLIFIAIKSYVI